MGEDDQANVIVQIAKISEFVKKIGVFDSNEPPINEKEVEKKDMKWM